ncbi:MAG: MGMT family protein [Candidatus Omnitrophota bacterium]
MVTSFQKSVYATVRTIPVGQVRTYAWVARRTGRPGAARAVGNALNANPWPVYNTPKAFREGVRVVPCHRVIRSDGSLGGFARGPEVKARFLRREGLTVCDGHVIIDQKLKSKNR